MDFVKNITFFCSISLSDAGYPGGSDDKEPACNARDPHWILGRGDHLEKGTSVFLPGESQGQRSLAGYIVHGLAKSQI